MSELSEVNEAVRPKLSRLFEPVSINRLVLRNRSMMSSMHLNLERFDDQFERMANFYALRARHAVGLIVTAGCAPDQAGACVPGGFSLKSDAEIDNHRLLTAAVHAEGGHIALQILHFGREAVHGHLVSASAKKLASGIFTPRPMTDEEIITLIGAYANCADRAIRAGYDAIELIYSQGFLVHQFLAPGTNDRTDRWGGSLENRMRLAVEIARAVRGRVGPDYPIVFRIPCMDLFEGGLSAEEALTLIERLRPFGIDMLSVSIGWHDSYVPTIAMVAPRAAFASATRLVRARFPDLPICASNRINDPRVAESLLASGGADMVAMARPFLADAAFMSKAQQNRFDDINPCIACNQNCLDYVFLGEPVGCSVNPQSVQPGEGEFPPLSREMKVAVVGGGIAGMGAALFLARRGAQVELFEESTELGGQLRLAVAVPDKSEFAGTVRYYRHALLRAGVRLHLGQRFDTATAASRAYDHVVVATGCLPRKPTDLPGLDLPHVRQYTDVLGEQCPIELPAVILGGGGVACDLAKYIVKRHDEQRVAGLRYLEDHAHAESVAPYRESSTPAVPSVMVLQRSSRKFAMRLGRTTRWIQMQDMERLGVQMRNKLEILAITSEGVQIKDKRTQAVELIPARSVLLAAGHVPQTALAERLAESGVPCSVIGAAATEGKVSATNISSALSTAYKLAMSF